MKKILYELAMIAYLLPLWFTMLLIHAGLWASKKLIGLTGWWWAINVYKSLHIFGEKLSRHIRRVLPE